MPAGAHIVISPYALQRRPDYWDAPDVFMPERFAPGAPSDRPKARLHPFGGGPRICIGNSFAMMEHAIVLAPVGPASGAWNPSAARSEDRAAHHACDRAAACRARALAR
jgi:hypothetical protein